MANKKNRVLEWLLAALACAALLLVAWGMACLLVVAWANEPATEVSDIQRQIAIDAVERWKE